MKTKYLIEEMTSAEFVQAVKRTDTVIVPMGTLEQHGPHLPLGTDVAIPIEIAKRVAERKTVLVAPPIYYGNSTIMDEMEGVISITPETLSCLALDLSKSFSKKGLRKIVFLNGHGDNTCVLRFIGHRARIESGALIVLIDWWTIASEEISKICESEIYHADEGETSMMLACRPKCVKMEKATKDFFRRNLLMKMTDGKPKNMPLVFLPFQKAYTTTGTVGDATKASVGKGEKILEAVVTNICNFLTHADESM